MLALLSFSKGYSQEKFYSWYDEQTGIENSNLFKGIEYIETHRVINELDQFFGSRDFREATITYNGQTFYNVPIKYNIYKDVVIVNPQYNQKSSIFQLVDNRVQEFTINEHQFIYLNALNNPKISGFFEILADENKLKIYKKHKMKMKELRDRQVVYHEFEKAKAAYYFEFQNEVFELENKRNLYGFFPDLKNEIRDFYRNNRSIRQDNSDNFMKNLATKINSIISNTKFKE
ncbi:hypothetical protein [Salegentibacter sp. 24]|uniref:hypothetical protein n=1 Tax=Salegentibacter sp. 24 TaxID=2183986 RepID=UPI00105FD9CF|nr:hypothetical protein [Salegentibacter sp. 24]